MLQEGIKKDFFFHFGNFFFHLKNCILLYCYGRVSISFPFLKPFFFNLSISTKLQEGIKDFQYSMSIFFVGGPQYIIFGYIIFVAGGHQGISIFNVEYFL